MEDEKMAYTTTVLNHDFSLDCIPGNFESGKRWLLSKPLLPWYALLSFSLHFPRLAPSFTPSPLLEICEASLTLPSSSFSLLTPTHPQTHEVSLPESSPLNPPPAQVQDFIFSHFSPAIGTASRLSSLLLLLSLQSILQYLSVAQNQTWHNQT